jgi:hypothetical protein
MLKKLAYILFLSLFISNISYGKAHEIFTGNDKNLVTKIEYANKCEENGSCYGDKSELTQRPKTVDVPGYYRKDGTYVRGHYRSQ